MKSQLLSGLALAGFSVLAFAEPLVDNAHDRVQTTFDPGKGFERIGTVAQRDVRSVGRSSLAIDCSMLPRGYGDFEQIKDYLPSLGVVRVRLHAGWAKLEPQPGVWDFAWLDRQVNWLFEHGLEPMLETSYGNPAYPDAGGASLSDGMPRGEAALAAWDRYVEKLAERYPQVKDWACWNEPNNIDANTPEIVVDNNIRTAQIIRRHVPDARIAMLTLGTNKMNAFTEACLKLFKERNAISLFHWIIYHDYSVNPDACFRSCVDDWAKIVRTYAPELKIWMGEAGATSDPHYSAGISSMKWNTELTQCKWNARRQLSDLGHGYDSLLFTVYDPCYTDARRYCRKQPVYWVSTRENCFMKRMGLLKCNDRLKVTKVKPAYYTMQNIASVFDASVVAVQTAATCTSEAKGVVPTLYAFRRQDAGTPLFAYWNAARHPDNDNRASAATLALPSDCALREPVIVDMVTGAIYAVPAECVALEAGQARYRLPIYDAPLLLTDKSLVIR